MLACTLATSPAATQEIERGVSALDLPRPGFETGRWRIGNILLAPQIVAEGHYDSNVFATSRDARDDFVVNVGPRVDITADGTRLNLEADAEANGRIHASNGSEDSLTFGAGTAASFTFGAAGTLDGKLRFDRAVQSRADPEANPTLFHPAKLDSFGGDIGWKYERGRIGLVMRGGFQRINYLDAADEDRDLTNYSGSIKTGWVAAPGITIFLQGYGNRRDARLPVDRSGIDRDVTTLGVLTGVTFDITGRLRGDFGVGGFRANPDGALPSFSGLALNGKLVWTPLTRLAISLQALRGDAATIRAGASGRIDTRIGLRVDAEARHNLLLHGGIGFEAASYRGDLLRRLRTYSADVEAEYLVSRTLSFFIRASQTSRHGTSFLDRFDRTTAGCGIRVRV